MTKQQNGVIIQTYYTISVYYHPETNRQAKREGGKAGTLGNTTERAFVVGCNKGAFSLFRRRCPIGEPGKGERSGGSRWEVGKMDEQRAKMTQHKRIMRHLRKYGTLTSMEAISLYGIMKLSTRISELRARGERIETVMRKGLNRYGEPVRYAEYHLQGNEEERTWKKGS